MFCGQCGKRVLDTMLFCPFCGAPIVIPDQDEPAPTAPTAQPEPAPVAEPQPAEPEVAEPEAAEPEVIEPEVAGTEAEREAAADALFAVAPEPEPAPEPVCEHAPEPEPEPEPEPPHAPEPEPEPAPAPEGEETFEPLFPERGAARHEPESEPAPEAGRPMSLFDDLPIIDVEENEDEEDEEPIEDDAPRRAPLREPVRYPRPARRAPESRGQGHAYIPVKDVDPDDMFMDAAHPRREDDYDLFGEERGEDFGGDFDFEEPEPTNFWQRHIRGLVGLALLFMVIVIFFIWAAMPRGQRVLASANLAWRASAYDDLGHDAYDAGQYRQAAEHFKRALARDEDNYEYAHSAMVSYYEAKDIEASLAMLKKCIRMDPDNAEPYHELLILYPDAASRPFEVTELLRDGYARTGDATLDPDAA